MAGSLSHLTKDDSSEVKKHGFSDKQIAFATKSTEKEVRSKRNSFGVTPSYKRVDACAAEFEANTPFMYSSYDSECESAPTKRNKVLILGGGPNRIEDILNVIELERPGGIIVQFGGQTPLKLALIQQYLDKHKPLSASGARHVHLWSTSSSDSIDAAEDRGSFNAILKELNIEQPKGGIA